MVTDAFTSQLHRPGGLFGRRSLLARVVRTVGLVALTVVGGADLLRRHDVTGPILRARPSG